MRFVPRVASLRTLIVAFVLALGVAASAGPAQADNCDVTRQGIDVTDYAANGQTGACAPQVGRPATTGTGRKVG